MNNFNYVGVGQQGGSVGNVLLSNVELGMVSNLPIGAGHPGCAGAS